MQDYASHILAAASAEFAGYQGSPTTASQAVDLSTGEIRIEHPLWLRDTIAEAARNACLGYVDPQGIAGLRARYASFLNGQGYHVDARQVLVTAGAKEAIWVALIAHLGRGDAVLLPRPGWTPYFMWAEALGARSYYYDPCSSNLAEEIGGLIAQACPSVLVLNSPQNPTGSEFSQQDLASVVAQAKQHQVTIVSDEVYRYFALAHPAGSLLDHLQEGGGQFISIDSISKMLALAGVRIGFLLADAATVKKLEIIRSSFGSCVSSVSQSVAQALLQDDRTHGWLNQVAQVSGRTLSTVGAYLGRHGYQVESTGALYLWVQDPLAATGQYTTHITVEGGAAARVSPGHLYGSPGYFRVCPVRENTLLQAVFPGEQTFSVEEDN